MGTESVVLGLSGGVDSAVAARLLLEAGYTVYGHWLDIGLGGGEDAATLAHRMGLPFQAVDIRERLEHFVCADFQREYLAGRTPLPCARCNPLVKFPALLEVAEAQGAQYVATGHYARIDHQADGTAVLQKSSCLERDQSYMLYRLSQEQLAMLLLPLEGLEKPQVREIARQLGLVCADAPDSQEICWLPDGDYAAFIEQTLGKSEPGDFVSPDGQVCGRHKGLLHYTVGQRKHLGVALGYPVFIKEIDPEQNRIYLARTGEEYAGGVLLTDCVIQPNPWLNAGQKTAHVLVKVRSRAPDAPATVTLLDDGRAQVVFDAPQRAPAPGQSCVIYRDAAVLGGGFIQRQI